MIRRRRGVRPAGTGAIRVGPIPTDATRGALILSGATREGPIPTDATRAPRTLSGATRAAPTRTASIPSDATRAPLIPSGATRAAPIPSDATRAARIPSDAICGGLAAILAIGVQARTGMGWTRGVWRSRDERPAAFWARVRPRAGCRSRPPRISRARARQGHRNRALPRQGRRIRALTRQGRRSRASPRRGQRYRALLRQGRRSRALTRQGRLSPAAPRRIVEDRGAPTGRGVLRTVADRGSLVDGVRWAAASGSASSWAAPCSAPSPPW